MHSAKKESQSVFRSILKTNLPRNSSEVIRVETEKLQPNPDQARRYFDPERFEKLKASIQDKGILTPLLVRPLPQEGRFEIVAGERRYRAATELGLASIPVVPRELDDSEAAQLSLIENLQRADLNPVEETKGVIQLLTLTLKLSPEGVVDKLHKAAYEARVGASETPNLAEVTTWLQPLGVNVLSFANNRLPLLKLPEDVLEALQQGKIEYTKARTVATLKDERKRRRLLREVAEQGLSLKEVKERLGRLQARRVPTELTPEARTKRLTQLVKKNPVLKEASARARLDALLSELESLLAGEPIS